ncbi:MAG: hypothetical protein U9O98_09480 [Asgard group archaeon]|nr:hypothetical protein [Asgard group archaeon]
MTNNFLYPITNIQPSQLFINKNKLTTINELFIYKGIESISPIPLKRLDNEIIYVDGHTRALVLYQNAFKKIPAIWEPEELDWDAYRICVSWCKNKGIYTIADLESRIISNKEYQITWINRCQKMHKKLDSNRN